MIHGSIKGLGVRSIAEFRKSSYGAALQDYAYLRGCLPKASGILGCRVWGFGVRVSTETGLLSRIANPKGPRSICLGRKRPA